MTVFFNVVFPLGHSLEVFAFKFPRPATSGLAYSMIRSFIDFVFGFNGEESVGGESMAEDSFPTAGC